MNMKSKTKLQYWMRSLLFGAAFTGSACLCQAQAPIVYDFASDLQGWSLNNAGTGDSIIWNATGGSTGGGCMQVSFDGTDTTEADPWVTLPATLNQTKYINVTVELKVDSASGKTGTGGSGGYGFLQLAFRDSSFSFDGIFLGSIFPPAANQWVTYTFTIPQPYKTAEQYLQLQFAAGSGSTAPVTFYVDKISINPVPDPFVLDAFTSSATVGSAWDSSEDAPFFNPVNGSGPTSFTPPGSWNIQISDPGGYNGFNQYTPAGGAIDLTRFQSMGFDVFLDGTSGTTYGGCQVLMFQNGYSGLTYIGGINFNASMVGKWTHFDFPCAVSGITACPAFAIQGTPGSDGGTDNTTFHVDNLVLWSPQITPRLGNLTPGSPGGASMAVDGDGTANQFDQEGICTPSADNNAKNFFWINQTPATYSITLTNFPSPALAPGFDAHFYIINGDTVASGSTGGFNYNETYSGANYNAYDEFNLQIQNGTSGGVVVNLQSKVNAPSSNPITYASCVPPGLTSANGTWALNFTDNTHVTILGPGGILVSNVTLPDYSASFAPATSFIHFGVFKNDGNATGVNNNQSATFASILVTNSTGVQYNENFGGPGLTANYSWLIAEYYQDAANRVTWVPQNTAFWLKWGATGSGVTVQNALDAAGPWGTAGVTYTYIDTTGTNTVAAIPSSIVAGQNAEFFRLQKN
jgi:hypothetical protein